MSGSWGQVGEAGVGAKAGRDSRVCVVNIGFKVVDGALGQ